VTSRPVESASLQHPQLFTACSATAASWSHPVNTVLFRSAAQVESALRLTGCGTAALIVRAAMIAEPDDATRGLGVGGAAMS
jgi:hypothetical protein